LLAAAVGAAELCLVCAAANEFIKLLAALLATVFIDGHASHPSGWKSNFLAIISATSENLIG
jgi:hypothetical protein